MEPFYQLSTVTKRYGHLAYSHLGDRHLHIAEWYRRRIEHYADHSKERTREFGIRKALGAKPFSILWLIIVESVTITTLYRTNRDVAGIAATEWMNKVAGEQTVDVGMFSETVFLYPMVDISIAIQATLTLVVAGTLAGFFPAKKAVSIRPIEALRAD